MDDASLSKLIYNYANSNLWEIYICSYLQLYANS